jgi:putative ABC transport system permease protein
VRHARLRHALSVLQIAFCFILLVGGGLFARTLGKAYTIDLGFRPKNLLLVDYNFRQSQIASVERVRSFKQELVRQLADIPGVESAAIADPPLTSFRRTISVSDFLTVQFEYVGAGFFPTMGIPVLRGREFNQNDQMFSPRVAVVNQTLARLLASDADVVGRVLKLSQGPPAQIVGVAADSKHHSVWDAPEPRLYMDVLQSSGPGSTVIARTRGRPESVIPKIRGEWDRIAPGIPLLEIATGEDQVNRSLAPQRAAAALLAGFSVLAAVLASIGLFSAMAHLVTQRTREIGIRIAIGANSGTVVRQVLGRALLLTGFGIAVGSAVSIAAMRLIASQIRDVSPNDALTFMVVTLLVIAVSLGAAWTPARHAARIDPVRTLRME